MPRLNVMIFPVLVGLSSIAAYATCADRYLTFRNEQGDEVLKLKHRLAEMHATRSIVITLAEKKYDKLNKIQVLLSGVESGSSEYFKEFFGKNLNVRDRVFSDAEVFSILKNASLNEEFCKGDKDQVPDSYIKLSDWILLNAIQPEPLVD